MVKSKRELTERCLRRDSVLSASQFVGLVGGDSVANKHVNDDKPPGYGGKSVSGSKEDRTPGEKSADQSAGRERNVGKDEEHSRTPKGNRG